MVDSRSGQTGTTGGVALSNDEQKTNPSPQGIGPVSWGPKLFLATLAALLLFFWWLLIYSGGVSPTHG